MQGSCQRAPTVVLGLPAWPGEAERVAGRARIAGVETARNGAQLSPWPGSVVVDPGADAGAVATRTFLPIHQMWHHWIRRRRPRRVPPPSAFGVSILCNVRLDLP